MSSGSTAVIIGYGTLGPGALRPLWEIGVRRIIITNRTTEKLAKSLENAQSLAPSFEYVCLVADVTDEASAACFAEKLSSHCPDGIDIVVMAAGGNEAAAVFNKLDAPRGTSPAAPLPMAERMEAVKKYGSWSAKAMRDVYEKNVLGPVEYLYALLPSLIVQDRVPVVITIGSVSPHLSGVNHYAAAKVALCEETKRLSHHLAWDRRALGLAPGRAVCIVWGFTQSEQSGRLVQNPDGTPTFRGTRILEATPVGRFGTPAELGECIAFAVQNQYQGPVWLVDGGFSDSAVV